MDDKLLELIRRVMAAGPFYEGIDDQFCAVCFGELPHHKPDCAYVALERLLSDTGLGVV